MKLKSLTKNDAFTLIELLVVISIIAILMAIMMPALSRAKSQASSVVCKTRLGDIGKAMAMYAIDNNDAVPSSIQSAEEMRAGKSQYEVMWLRRLVKYYEKLPSSSASQTDLYEFASFDLLRCPTQNKWQKQVQDWIADGSVSEWISNPKSMYRGMYALNMHFVQEADNKGADQYNPVFTFRKYSQIKQPVSLPLVGDSNGDVPGTYTGDKNLIASSIMYSHFGPHPVAIDYGWKGEDGRPPQTYLRGPAPNHNGKTNYLMADMHVEDTGIWPWVKEWGNPNPDLHPRRARRGQGAYYP
jgi:prepilin-type N-terminal cleavage/methylation domain-containing protein/prepilin-type processing-associated H-X9-DG protein